MVLTPTLYTPRLTLRPFTLADAPRVRELAGDPKIAATTAHIPHPYPQGLAEDWISTHGILAQENRQFHFAITLAGTRTPGREHDLGDTGHLIGCISLILTGPPAASDGHVPARAELGYWIGVPYWNHGFATEAAHAVLAFGFQRKELCCITARCIAINLASTRVLEKIGMTHDGTHSQSFTKGHDLLDLECFAIDRQQWQATRKRPRITASATTVS